MPMAVSKGTAAIGSLLASTHAPPPRLSHDVPRKGTTSTTTR